MDLNLFLETVNRALFTGCVIALPILIPGLLAGVLISLFQAVTQINEQTLTFVPKLFILVLTIVIAGPWIIRFSMDYLTEVIHRVSIIGNPGLL